MLITLLASAALAVPVEFTHTGRMLDQTTGLPLTQSHSVQFTIYDADLGGTQIWQETATLNFDEGYYTHLLGVDGSNTIDATVFVDNATLYLGIAVDGGAELPRQRLVSVPWAVAAQNVVGGTVDASEIRVDGNVVIDSTGTITAPSAGPSLADLSCAQDQVSMYDGTDWTCASLAAATWDDLLGVPVEFVDGIDNDLLATVTCPDGDRLTFSGGNWGCSPDPAAETWATLSGIPADLLDGDQDTIVTWATMTGIPADLLDGDAVLDETAVDLMTMDNGFALDADISAIGKSGSWLDLLDIPGDIADGDDDTVGALSCVDGEVARLAGGAWTCVELDSADDIGALDLSGGTLSGGLAGTDADFSGTVKIGGASATCNAGDEGTMRFDGLRLEFCGPGGWQTIAGSGDGSSPSAAAASCQEIQDNFGVLSNGTYWIDHGIGPFQTYCDFTTDGGGWTLVWKHSYLEVGSLSNEMRFFDQSVNTPCIGGPTGSWCNIQNKTGFGASELRISASHNGTVAYDYVGTLDSRIDTSWQGAILTSHRQLVDVCTQANGVFPEPVNNAHVGVTFDKYNQGDYTNNCDTNWSGNSECRWHNCQLPTPAFPSSTNIQMTLNLWVR